MVKVSPHLRMDLTDVESMNTVEFCFKHINGSCIKTAQTAETRILIYFVLVLATLITLAGNLVVIISISHFKQLHSPSNMLVFSLAVADFLVGLCVMPFSMVTLIETCWHYGDLLCKFHFGLDFLLCTVSIFLLVFIAVNNYYAVCDPLRYPNKITIQVAWIFITIAWLAPGFYTFGTIYNAATDERSEPSCIGQCYLYFNKILTLMDFLTFFIPCLIMVGIYAKIFLVARRQVRKIKNMENMFRTKEEQSVKASRNREHKAMKTLALVMGIFLFCWLPYRTDMIIEEFSDITVPVNVFDAVSWLGYLNSSVNPFIYAFFFPWFRKAFKLIFTGEIFASNSSSIQLYGE
ncbi:trace amine-associated receptor 13c-like [Latimeria chalumnae]|uniref:trace amine-associated receptor 13c-like n=1 Tax=Latimeria chalumnae TaxID=7897 RepID=UPI0003C141E9|nr:PREDICTED: trace amine-associated receptor 13c-like [Latimeria chalumnae]|eukprot:XP_006013827.1 PREDICTED: trace amine-associated receptor 13c-like [Latimeria chalumnae]